MARGRKPTEGLTEKNKQVLDAILSFIRENGLPPTYDQIGARMKLSYAGVQPHIKRLCKFGYLSHAQNQTRDLVPLMDSEGNVLRQRPAA